jgi:hypothetical protein
MKEEHYDYSPYLRESKKESLVDMVNFLVFSSALAVVALSLIAENIL